MKQILFIIFFIPFILFSQNNFSLEDLNSTSDYFGMDVGPSVFENEVAIVYFGHYN